jgi:hypothetical protein
MTKVRRYIAVAPLTFAWISELLATKVIQHMISPQRSQYLLAARSTNLHHLAFDPLHVLFTSLLWIDGRHWWPYLLLFIVFLAPTERWLGTLRSVSVGFISHTWSPATSARVICAGASRRGSPRHGSSMHATSE